MTTFLLSFGIFVLSGIGLAIGVLVGRDPIKGSCGGVSCGVPGGCAGCLKTHPKDAEQ